MILVLTPSLLIQFAVISPAGPDPTIRTSTLLLSIFIAPISFLVPLSANLEIVSAKLV
jgi:hypothetical protein